jgi:hypothetical protein
VPESVVWLPDTPPGMLPHAPILSHLGNFWMGEHDPGDFHGFSAPIYVALAHCASYFLGTYVARTRHIEVFKTFLSDRRTTRLFIQWAGLQVFSN